MNCPAISHLAHHGRPCGTGFTACGSTIGNCRALAGAAVGAGVIGGGVKVGVGVNVAVAVKVGVGVNVAVGVKVAVAVCARAFPVNAPITIIITATSKARFMATS